MISHGRQAVSLAPSPSLSPAAKRNYETVPRQKQRLGKSKRLHNFCLPVLKWRGTRTDVRSDVDRADAGDHPDLAFPVQLHSDDVLRALPSLAVETTEPLAGRIDTGYSELKEFGEKLLDDLRSALKTEFGLLECGGLGSHDKDAASVAAPRYLRARSTRPPPDERGGSTRMDGTASSISTESTPETESSLKSGRCLSADLPKSASTIASRPPEEEDTGGGHEDHSSSTKRTWNLRRMGIKCELSDIPLGRVAPAMTSTPAKASNAMIKLAKSSRFRSRAAGDSGSRRKFPLQLTKEEVDHDWLVITGSRPSRRPAKRPRNVQKQLDSCFPGSFLWAVTPEMYRVPHPLE